MIKAKTLASHPLLELVFDNMRPTLDKSTDTLKKIAKTGEIRSKGKYLLTEDQSYDVYVFQCAHALLNCVYQLEDIRKLIRRFPSPRTYEKESISQYRWIEYHYSYFVVTLVALTDTALILVNAVFRLGNPEKLCKPELMKSNEWVKKTNVNKSLQRLENVVKDHRQIRNLSVHRGQAPELYRVFKSDLLDYLKLYSFVNLLAEPIIDKKLLDLAFKGERRKICERLEIEILEVKEAVWKLFDSLLSTYKTHAGLLKKTVKLINLS